MTPKDMNTISEEAAMGRALALARRGSGFTRPNPMVGAVVVNDGSFVGYGWHKKVGGDHAEVDALRQAGTRAESGTLYVTLEPCNHHGRTPPCTEAILEAGISRVVVAMGDPNPKVRGGGIARLREAGVEVEVGLLAAHAEELNLGWVQWLRTHRPLVVSVLRLSLDGKVESKVGNHDGTALRISDGHLGRFRRYVDAVLIGSEVILAENPAFPKSHRPGVQPLRVVVDAELEIKPDAHVYRALSFEERGPSPVAKVITTTRASFQRRRALELAGVEVHVFEDKAGQVDLGAALELLGSEGLQAILCEGGPSLVGTLLRANLCQRLLLYRSPKLLGLAGADLMMDAEIGPSDRGKLDLRLVRRVGPDSLSVYAA